MPIDFIGDSIGYGNDAHAALTRKEDGFILRVTVPASRLGPDEWHASFKLNGVTLKYDFKPRESHWEIHIGDEKATITDIRVWVTASSVSPSGSAPA